ncbi:MAG: hypothetical protein H0X03_06495 [Nitrosopumilus sp.]|nr:hypothetical protein [Nitrosopumilus sp.]
MSDEEKITFNTHFRQVPGLGLVAVVPKEWLNKKVKFEYEEKEFETDVMYRGKRSIIRLNYKSASGGPVTVKLLN